MRKGVLPTTRMIAKGKVGIIRIRRLMRLKEISVLKAHEVLKYWHFSNIKFVTSMGAH